MGKNCFCSDKIYVKTLFKSCPITRQLRTSCQYERIYLLAGLGNVPNPAFYMISFVLVLSSVARVPLLRFPPFYVLVEALMHLQVMAYCE